MLRRRKVLLGLGTAVAVAGCAGDDEEPEVVDETEEEADTSTETDEDETDEPAEEPEGDAEEEKEEEDVEAVVGDHIAAGDMSLVVEEVRRDADLGEFAEPDAGNEFVSVIVALKNTSDDFVNVSNLLQTRIQDDEGYSYDQTFFGGDTPTFNDGQFAPGEVERGAINFEIPDDASGLKLIWDFSVGLFGGLNRAEIDLEAERDIHRLEQDLAIDTHGIDDTVEFQDTQVTVNEVRTESELGMFAQPDEGNEYVIVDISIANNTGEEQRISTALQMLIKDDEGWSYQEDFSATAELDRDFDELSPVADGETRRGEVVYEIEEDLSPLYWVFEFSLWTDGDKTFWELR